LRRALFRSMLGGHDLIAGPDSIRSNRTDVMSSATTLNVELAECLHAEIDGAVLILTLNRPSQRNALNFELRSALRAAFDEYDERDDLRCAILTGNGPAFCAGGDLKEMAQTAMAIPPAEVGMLLGSTGKVSKPVIAAVNGFALAGGFRLTMDCDLVIASADAQFAITEVKRGRGAPWAVPLKDMMSHRHMAEILLIGDPITADRAYEMGFVNRIVEPAQLLPEALRTAHAIARNAPLSVLAAKALIGVAAESGTAEALRKADEIYRDVYLSEDAQEGPRAFAEKRDPVWRGR
jgi:enoyl-CoA hydratase